VTIETKTTDGSSAHESLDVVAARYGNRFLRDAAPPENLPARGMPAHDAMRLVEEELMLDGLPMRNLATFVTAWMEPEARSLIAQNLHRTSSITRSIRRQRRSSDAASTCSPTCSMLPRRRGALGRKGPPRGLLVLDATFRRRSASGRAALDAVSGINPASRVG
jgi:hypothetical protein